jgi:hypothetical protein
LNHLGKFPPGTISAFKCTCFFRELKEESFLEIDEVLGMKNIGDIYEIL